MQQNILTRNSREILAAGLAAAGGWLAFNSSILNEYGVAQLIMAGVALLVIAWRLGARGRIGAWSILFAWHLGAGTALPSGWLEFFGNHWGWAGWAIWSAVAAAPALLFPARFIPAVLAIASLITAATPIGMMNPLLAATAFFPGMGWFGLVLAVALLLLPAVPKKPLVVLGIATVMLGAAQNTAVDARPQSLPEGVWGLNTWEGAHPDLAVQWFARQGRVARQVREGVEQGAVLTVTPEGTVDSWDAWAQIAWREVAQAARHHGGMVLLGAYRQAPGQATWQNGLFDLKTGEFYGATVPMPISMWKPWADKEHYPIDFSQLPRTIPTPAGEAAYLLCFEELLVWPLVGKMAAGSPALLITAANQWFTSSTTSETQVRSVKLQARLWGLPMIRAVNWPR